ncbi:phosphoribosyltransferase, partial [bacterium]|nr:phosphoribosyltransferase [bacterium]
MPSPININLLEKVGALVTDSHIVYTSGKHGSSYVNKDAIYPHTELTAMICKAMAEPFAQEKIEVVLAPAIGGVLLGHGVARELSRLQGTEILSVYAEPTADKQFVIKRGYDKLLRNKKVLVVEDILTTGGSVRKVVEAARNIPAEVIGVSALCNRGGVTPEALGEVPVLKSLFTLNLESWDPDACPLCLKKVPIHPSL